MKNTFIKRDIDGFLSARMFGGKVIVVYGPRQAGKTTAIEHYLESAQLVDQVASFNGDETADREILADASSDKVRQLIGNKRIIFIDEAQKIPAIGMIAKRIYDKLKDVQVIITGSSSEDLAEKTEEPLTGRKFEYVMLPLSFSELAKQTSPVDECRNLEQRMVFGAYPDIITHAGDETERIRQIGKGYLYKDILKHETIRRPELIDKILRALAFQIGQEVSFNELAQLIKSDEKTISKYIDILEKAFIVFRLPSFSRNLRNELKKARKIYFYDLGIRNYVIGDWRPIAARNQDEVGHLWENYLLAERLKWRIKNEPDTRAFFWRNTLGSEIDLVEENATGIRAFEIKWNPDKGRRVFPVAFTTAYPEALLSTLTKGNYLPFLTPLGQ